MEVNYVYLSLGSNLGDRINNLSSSIRLIRQEVGEVTDISKVYETPPLGFNSKEQFLNLALKVNTTLNPFELLDTLQKIEIKVGRQKKSIGGNYESRLIDIDILYYNTLELKSENLEIPHPRIKDRLFVLKPLMDIDNTLKHINGQTIKQLIKQTKDKSSLSISAFNADYF